MNRTIRIGSRDSKLAVIQSEIVKNTIERAHPEIKAEIITMKTTGDMILDRNLDQVGGKGLFVKELDQALLDDRIDISVHSLKDMPMEILKELPVLAYTKREDPRDALIYKPGKDRIPEEGIIGSSSRRRIVQLKRLFPGWSFRGIRGNVQTRLRKLAEEDYDATVLAAAGLTRLGMEAHIGRILEVSEMIPAAGQGILAVQGRAGENNSFLECLQDKAAKTAALAERSFVKTLDGGCSSPIAAYAEIKGSEIRLTGLYYDEDADDYVTGVLTGEAERAEQIGECLALELKRRFE